MIRLNILLITYFNVADLLPKDHESVVKLLWGHGSIWKKIWLNFLKIEGLNKYIKTWTKINRRMIFLQKTTQGLKKVVHWVEQRDLSPLTVCDAIYSQEITRMGMNEQQLLANLLRWFYTSMAEEPEWLAASSLLYIQITPHSINRTTPLPSCSPSPSRNRVKQ